MVIFVASSGWRYVVVFPKTGVIEVFGAFGGTARRGGGNVVVFLRDCVWFFVAGFEKRVLGRCIAVRTQRQLGRLVLEVSHDYNNVVTFDVNFPVFTDGNILLV